jgi:hypothetical protein
MRKAIYILVALLIFDLSCKELDKFTMFDIEYSMSFSLNELKMAGIPLEIWAPPFATHSDSIFDHYSTSPGLIEEVTLTQLQLVIESPPGMNFNFLDSIAFSLASDNVAEKQVAWRFPVPSDNSDTLLLDTTPDDLRLFITEDSIRMKVGLVIDSLFNLETVFKMNMVFHVDAKILGI